MQKRTIRFMLVTLVMGFAVIAAIRILDIWGVSVHSGTASALGDTTPPTPPIVSVNDPESTTPTLTISGSSDVESGIWKYIIGWNENTFIVQTNAETLTWTLPHDKALDNMGPQDITIVAVDGAGNSSLPTSYTYTFRNGRPNAPSISTEYFTNSLTPTCWWASAMDLDLGAEHPVTRYKIGLWKGGSCVLTPVVVDGTTWTVPEGVLIDEGLYEFRVWSVDDTARESSEYGSDTFELDRTPPSSPVSITGPAYTNNTTQECSVVPPADSPNQGFRYRLEVWQNGACIWQNITRLFAGVGPVNPQLASGQNEVRAYAIDYAGNISAAYVSTFVFLDQERPQDMGPITGPQMTNDPHPVFSWDAVSDTGGSGLVGYNVRLWYMKGSYIEERNYIVPSSSGKISWSIPQDIVLTDGYCSIWVNALDGAGNLGNCFHTLSFCFDSTPPGLPDLSGISAVNTRTPCLSWEPAADNLTGVAAYSVELWQAGTCVWGPVRVTDASVQVNEALPEDGAYELRVWPEDGIGNVSSTCASRNILVDTMCPVAPSLVNGPEYTQSGTPSFECLGASDSGSGLDGYYVEVHKQSGELVQSFQANGAQWTVPARLSPDSQYEVRVWAKDRAGNRSQDYAGFSFVLDTVAPALSGPIQGPTVTNSTRPTFTLPAGSDSASGVDHYVVALYGGANPQDFTVPASGGPVVWTVPEGVLEQNRSYSMMVYCYDRAGNSSYGRLENGGYVEFGFTLDNIGPIVTILTPASGGTYTINESSSLWARANECALAQIRVDGGEWTDVTKVMADGSIFHFFATPLSPGVHTIELKVRDNAGNETVVSIAITISGQRKGFGFGRFSFPGPGQ